MKTMALLNSLIALVVPVVASAQPADLAASRSSQASGYSRVHLGRFTVTVLTDGTASVPYDKLLHGRPSEDIVQTFAATGETPERPAASNAS